MENTAKNIELIDKFIANERKSRMWTIISVVIFCLLGGIVFFLAYELNKSNALYKEQNVELKETQKKLAVALADLAARNESLQGDSLTLTKQVLVAGGKNDSLQKFCDTVRALFNTQSQLTNNTGQDPESRLDELSKKTFGNGTFVLSNSIKKEILNPIKWTRLENAPLTITLRHMPGYEKMASLVAEQLKVKKFTVSDMEIIEKISFNPTVKYFRDEDKDLAQTFATLMNESDKDFFKNNPVTVQKLESKAPLHQVEIWIGQYKQRNWNEILRNRVSYFKEEKK